MNEAPISPAPQKRDHVVAITAIIATALVMLVCIAGLSGVIIAAIYHVH